MPRGRSTCSHSGQPTAGSWTPGPHTSVYFLFLIVPPPKSCPAAPWDGDRGGAPGTSRMYLWTSLFHEALFEVVPGDEGHELGEERHTLRP